MAGTAKSRGSVKIIAFTLCVVKFFTLIVADGHRLNIPRILMPVFNDVPVNFTLEVTEGGCYQWSTLRSDIIRLIPINENYDHMCSSAVVVQTATKEPTRNTAIVLAEDVKSGHIIRCDVIVDAIFSLYMVTTTRELFIEEAPEAFEVRAYDEQGNEFTTLAGIEFSWAVGNSDKRGPQSDENLVNNVLRFMSFQESPYETPHTIEMLDVIGKRGNIVLLEGVKTGAAKVSVRLLHSEYKHVPPVEVDLVVVANLIIIPSDVTMMAYDCFTYKIMQVHQSRLEEVHLPSSQYYLEAENSNILEINNDRGSIYALARGRTKVSLHDKNVHEEYGVILPTASVSISDVAYITLTVLPHRSWALILGQTHEIVVDLYDNRDHKFYIGEGAEVIMEVEDQYFEKKFTTQNGTYTVVVPIQSGTTTIKATLHGVIDQDGRKIPQSPELTTQVEVTIHSPVIVHPQSLALPWDPKSKTRSDVALKASGGDGSFVWNSRQPSVATVSQNGVIKVLQKGSADVTVSMVRNPYNRDIAKVYILTPTKLEIIQYNMEAAIREPIFLHIALYGEMKDGSEVRDIPFNDCKDLPFEVYIPDGNFVQNESEITQPVGIGCAALAVVSLSTGTSTITVTYNTNGHYLMDNITVSAYDPLVVVHPYSGETVLSVGSSRKIIFKGGPHPWSGKLQGYRREMSISEEENVEITEEKQAIDSDISIFQVVCRQLGESILTFTVSNIPLLPTCKKTDAFATIRVICAKPRYIFLQPEFKDSENCPIKQNADKIMTHSNEVLQLLVVVKDEDGKKFDNITSLNIEWILKPQAGGEIEVPVGTIEEPFEDFYVSLPGNHYQRIIPKSFSDSLVLKAKITGYQKSVLSQLRITPEWPAFSVENERGTLATPLIEAAVNIILVNDTIINPNQLKVLNDPNSKYFLQVSQGSGFYEFVLSSEDIADVRYVEPTRTINVVPRRSGTLRITLIDLCLASIPAEVVIEVQQLASLEVETVNKVEKGKCIVAALKMYDTNGYIMMLPFLEALEIKTEIENGFIEVKKAPPDEHEGPPFDEVLYIIHGIEEGETQIIFSSGEGDEEIRSEPILIQVFPPLKLSPKNLTTLVGTIYQVTVTGGPKDAEIEFSTGSHDVCSVDRNGILEGKTIGQTRIISRAISFNSKGNRIVYSQDHTDVYVTNLEGVKIVVPTMRIKVGATIPLWVFGIPDNLTPLIIGSMKSPLSFTWMTSDPSLLSLHNMYEGTGINIRYQNEVSLRAKAEGPGIATVFLNVTLPFNALTECKADRIYNAFIKIEIFEELRLCLENVERGMSVILMAPNSAFKLQNNRDKYGETVFKILMSSVHGHEAEDLNALTQSTKLITIDKNGIVKSGESYGRTIVSITNIEAYSLKQTLTVIIDVKPIHYMMFSLKSKIRIRSGEELNMLPKGMELNYIVEYFDNVGTKFHAVETGHKTLANRGDLVSFTCGMDNLISAKFIENGKSIVKIYNEKHPNGIFDYVHIMIGDIHFPTKATLSVGDVACFSMPLLSPDGDPGFWQSSAPEIVAVDPISGIGRARNPGFAFIKHSLTTHLQGEIEVNVHPIAKISLLPLRGKNITGLEVFSVPLVIRGKDERIKENNVLSRGLGGCRTHSSFFLTSYPFTCTIQFIPSNVHVGVKDLFIAKPRFDIVTGFYYCDVIPMGSPNLISSTIETRLQIKALSRDIEGNPVEVAYLPPIYIGIKEVVFTNLPSSAMPTAFLEVYGLPQVLEHLTIDTPDKVTISGQQFISKHLFQYKLCLMQTQDEIQGQKIIVSNELTKQNISLFIRLPRYEQFAHISGIHWLDYVYFHRYSFGVFIVLFITFFHFWKNKMINVDVNVKNRNIFAEKYPPPLRKSTSPCSPTMNNSSNSSNPRSPSSPLRPFSAFEPVYGDPRSFLTPRRNRILHTP